MIIARAVLLIPVAIVMVTHADLNRNNRAQAMLEETNASSVKKEKKVPVGIWGGKNIGLQVTESGATIEFDCAEGQINQPLIIDNYGNFAVIGDYTAQRGGPVRIGDSSKTRPARYTGIVRGKTMILNVRLTDKQKNIGTFSLTHGEAVPVVKCL